MLLVRIREVGSLLFKENCSIYSSVTGSEIVFSPQQHGIKGKNQIFGSVPSIARETTGSIFYF